MISPLLANVYLDRLDQWWTRYYSGLGMLTRFADDLVILCWRPAQAERAREVLARLLARLHLQLSATKTRLASLEEERSGFDFLGYHYRWIPTRADRTRRYAACWPSRRSMQAARQRIRELTPAYRIGLPISMVVQDLNRFVQGWAAYFRHGNSTQQFKSLDGYVEDRLCRFIARKHGKRGVNPGLSVLLRSKTHLGLRRITGTIRYDSANAGRDRVRRAVRGRTSRTVRRGGAGDGRDMRTAPAPHPTDPERARQAAAAPGAIGQLSLCQIPYAPTREAAERLRDKFAARFGSEFPEAVACLERDWEALTRFYDFPEEHWKHLRTTNVVESPFASLRLRTNAAKRFKKVPSATVLIWKVLRIAESRWRRLDAPELLKDVYEGRRFVDGKPQTRSMERSAA